MTLNGTDYTDVITVQPGDIRTLNVLITTAPNSAVLAVLDVRTPVNTSALFTVHHVAVVSEKLL